MSEFHPFELEKFLSLHETDVKYNLSESGVQPLNLKELFEMANLKVDQLLSLSLGYPEVNGSRMLRSNIAFLYSGASSENVLVTIGAAEANYIAATTLLASGGEALVMFPNYMQIWGIAKNLGATVNTFHLREEYGWSLDTNELFTKVNANTRFIAVCNPNNPTGKILTLAEMQNIVDAASKVGAWIIADEVYSGAERELTSKTPSFFGMYEKVIAIGSMSKAYGLPGLRIGWLVAPEDLIQTLWRRHEYTAISASKISNVLAEVALEPGVREKILQRTKKLLNSGYTILEEWANQNDDILKFVPPQASAICFIKYNLEINSTSFAMELLRKEDILVVPGDVFNFDHHLRISYALPRNILKPALQRLANFLEYLRSEE